MFGYLEPLGVTTSHEPPSLRSQAPHVTELAGALNGAGHEVHIFTRAQARAIEPSGRFRTSFKSTYIPTYISICIYVCTYLHIYMYVYIICTLYIYTPHIYSSQGLALLRPRVSAVGV